LRSTPAGKVGVVHDINYPTWILKYDIRKQQIQKSTKIRMKDVI
jgi:hypothetical protein